MNSQEMNNREVALEFVKSFCAGDINELAPLLANDLKFKGPLFQFESSVAYMRSLQEDPPEKSGYRLLSVTESNDSVSIFYEYQKREGPITIAQSFRIANRKISEILLVFDTREFA
ncbi:MAG: hypothetical protein V3U24_05310 [Candidatus Neomarinimicrobiota bacterium]